MANLEDEFGDIIAKARMGLGYLVDKLAASTGLSSSDIESIEAYKYIPNRQIIFRLAEELSLNPDKLEDIANGAWVPNVSIPQNGMLIKEIEVVYGSYRENCYIVCCKATRTAAVVDPGGSVDAILQYLAEQEFILEFILITHAHADHIGGLRQLLDKAPNVRLVGCMQDQESFARFSSLEWEIVQEGVPVPLGNMNIAPIHTPGHTSDSTCYYVNGVCFVGDTLFAGSIGRPSSPQIYKQMLENIQSKILMLSDDTILLPGHGPATSVSEEKAHNPFF